jgi:putative salt-induced outer membrane protein
MLQKIVWPFSLAAAGMVSPAQAALPEPVKAMIEAAIASGKDAEVRSVVKFAKVANPDDVAEIDAMFAAYTAKKTQLAAAEKKAKMEAPFFENWTGEGELGGFRNTGNSSNVGISGGIKLAKDAVDWRLKFRARADYQRSNGVTSREQYAAALEPEYKIDDRLFIYGLAQYDRDRFQGFSSRYTVSGGIGYTVIKEKDIFLDVKAGPAWRLTEFTEGGADSSIAGLIGLDLGWQIAKNLKLTQGAGATLASDAQSLTSANVIFSSGTNTLTATTGLDAKINGKLSARLSYAIEHETNPPDGREKTDTLSRATLVYDF